MFKLSLFISILTSNQSNGLLYSKKMISFEDIKSIIAEVMELEIGDINQDMKLDPDDNWDSIVVVSLIAELDDMYDLIVDGSLLAECKSIQEFLELINSEK